MKRLYRSGDHTLIREINLSTVLRRLQEGPALSRAGLAAITGLNKTTVSSLVERLIAWNLVYEVGRDTTGNGRPATLLALNPQAGAIIGLELGVDFISIIVANFTGEIEWRSLKETDPADSQETILHQAFFLIDEALSVAEAKFDTVLGLGVAVPGLVNVDEGVLLFSPNLQWRNVPLGQIFSDHSRLPVFVENDANAAALGEHLFGLARRSRNFLFLALGIGLGGGLFLNGDLYRGQGGIAGEIGHTNFTGSNRPCRCGQRGCWETSVNQYALIERVWASLDAGHPSKIRQFLTDKKPEVSLLNIEETARAGDRVVLEALAETGLAIGLGLANLINIFNPEIVILGGMMSKLGDYLLPAINSMVAKHVLAELRPQTEIVLSHFGPWATVNGAVSLVLQAVLANPGRTRNFVSVDGSRAS